MRITPEGALERVVAALAEPLTDLPDTPGAAWVRLTGRLSRDARGLSIVAANGPVTLDRRCDQTEVSGLPGNGQIAVAEGIADGRTQRLVVGCDTIRPAPVLTRAGSELITARRAADAALPSAPPPSEGSDLPALLLLTAAASGTGITGVVAWRRGTVARLLAGEQGGPPGD
jgi:hypothetical protein